MINEVHYNKLRGADFVNIKSIKSKLQVKPAHSPDYFAFQTILTTFLTFTVDKCSLQQIKGSGFC